MLQTIENAPAKIGLGRAISSGSDLSNGKRASFASTASRY